MSRSTNAMTIFVVNIEITDRLLLWGDNLDSSHCFQVGMLRKFKCFEQVGFKLEFVF